jgi:HlyD family secretion protein
MIESSSTMDRPVVSRRFSRKTVVMGGLALLPLIGGALLLPSLVQWMGSERSFDLNRLRLAVVQRGDLERDLSVQGRVVAAFHPTTFSPATGTVTLHVRAGEVVEQGQPLASVDGPELRSRLEQERSSLQSLLSDLERQRIGARQTALADQQRIDLAEVELEAARRGMQRAERSRAELIINDVEYEGAQDAVRRAELELRHARQDGALRGETLEFETRNSERQVERQQLVVAELARKVEE